MNLRFLAIAHDPSIIPGVHHYCDEWCDYCPVSSRCLGFRCTAEFRRQHRRKETDATFKSMEEAIAFTRDVAEIDGSPTEDLDALIGTAPGQSGHETADPLAAVAWDYTVTAAFLFTPPSMTAAFERYRRSGPSPEEVVLWYHLRIYLKLVRALVSREHSLGADRGADDANGCAKLVLVSVGRSRAALASVRSAGNAPEIDRLIGRLDELQRGLDERFPLARRYIRAGIDCPVVLAGRGSMMAPQETS